MGDSCQCQEPLVIGKAFILEMPVIIKSSTNNGKRIVEVEASSEEVDSEGDVILQKALMDSAHSFIKTGHLDIDHISEMGDRLGIPNPSSYIIGVPMEVKDIGNGRTSVVGQIFTSSDGTFDPAIRKCDEFWASLQVDPPVRWRASIYGFPVEGKVDDCSKSQCDHGATRYLVKGIDWRSLAFTRNPVNQSLKGEARIITAKALVSALKGYAGMPAGTMMINSKDIPPAMAVSYNGPARNREELYGRWALHMGRNCPHTDSGKLRTIASLRNHFMDCDGMGYDDADLHALAMMQLLRSEDRRRQ